MKLRKVLALIPALLCGVSASAIEQIDGVYQIGTAEDMTAFAELVNGGTATAKAILTADIDFTGYNTMLGDGTAFAGVLDGQGHSITVDITGGEDGAYYVAFIRELDGGTVENLVLKGSVASASYHAGGIVGHTKNDAVVRNVVSEVNLSQIGNAGVAAFGGFVGHIQHTLIENCIFAGSIRTVGNSTSGVTGWADNLRMYNCAVIADIEVGDLAACFADSRGIDITQENFYYKTPLGGTCFEATQVTDEQIRSGELCWLLNKGKDAPLFYQTIGDDAFPVPFSDHCMVLPVYSSEGTAYAMVMTNDDVPLCADEILLGEKLYADDVVCGIQVKTEYEAAIDELLTGLSTRSGLWTAYQQLMEKKEIVKNSVAAYQTYVDALNEARTYVEEHFASLEGTYFEKLQTYLSEYGEPSDDFAHGTSVYIMEERLLSDEDILAEANYVAQLLKMAIENGYIAGADITSMLRNPRLDGGTEGWDTEGTIRVESGLGTAWGQFAMSQQVEGIQKDGLYAFVSVGFYQGDADGSSLHFASYIRANDICNYVAMPGEDNAEPRNIVVANVTDKQLTVGIETVGEGSDMRTTVSNCQLYYLGTFDEASEMLDDVLRSMKNHASSILDKYEFEHENYYEAPNFSQALKDELLALTAEDPSTGEEKYGLVCRYSDLFQRIFECKMAYARMMDFVDRVTDELYRAMGNGLLTEEKSYEYMHRIEAMVEAYQDGLYTAVEAEENCQWEIEIDIDLPQVDDIYVLSTAEQLATLCKLTSSGVNKLHARLAEDIDFTGYNTMLGDGTAFAGVLDGQGHSITVDITGGEDGAYYVAFIRELDGGTVENLVLKGSVASASYHAGGIVGHTKNDAVVRNVVSEVNLSQIGNAGVAAFGGFVGHIQHTLIENCIFAGSIRTVGNSTSGVTGWADNLRMYNCAVIADIEVGDLAACFADSRGIDITQENFYYKTPLGGTCFEATQVTDEQIRGGELCYLLNGDQSEIRWTQLLGEEEHPMPFYRDEAVVLKQDDGTYGNPTGVAAVTTDVQGAGAVYDLSGRRTFSTSPRNAESLPKGIYIIRDGQTTRKVLVK